MAAAGSVRGGHRTVIALRDKRAACRVSGADSGLERISEATGRERWRVYVAREILRVTMEDMPDDDAKI